MYLIDKIESVQRFFTRKLHELRNLSYLDRLHILGLETLEHRRLIHDLILCYKYLHGLIDTDNIIFFCGSESPYPLHPTNAVTDPIEDASPCRKETNKEVKWKRIDTGD